MHILLLFTFSILSVFIWHIPAQSTGTQDTDGSHTDTESKICGKPQNPPARGYRIVGGGYVQNNSWPWACALVQEVYRPGKGMTYRQFCDCTLIDDRGWVVTAGHCGDTLTPAQRRYYVKVYLGVENLNRAVREPRFKYNVSQWITHEKFWTKTKDFDIALIKLDRSVDVDNDTMPACLPNRHVADGDYVHKGSKDRKLCFIGGWGHTAEGQPKQGVVGSGTDFLKQASAEVWSREDCRRTGLPLTERMFCAGFDRGGTDTCQGDSGGPLVCDDGNGTYVLHGIVSWGKGCARPNAPGIYTNVWSLKSWIHNKTGVVYNYEDTQEPEKPLESDAAAL